MGRKTKRNRKAQQRRPVKKPSTAPFKNKAKLIVAVCSIVFAATVIVAVIKLPGPKKPDNSKTTEPASHGHPDKPYVELTEQQQIEAYKKEEYELAERLFTAFPNTAKPYEIMGNLHRRHGNSVEAVKLWKQAFQLDPSNAELLNSIAHVAMEKEQFAEAVEYWQKALQINPKMTNVHTSIAQALASEGNYADALKHYLADIANSSPTAVRYYFTGQAYAKLAQYEDAKKVYEKALQLDPKHVNTHFGLVTVYTRLKQPDKAKECRDLFRRLKAAEDEKSRGKKHSLEDDLQWVKEGLVALCLDAQSLYGGSGNFAKAEQLLAKAQSLDSDNPDVARKFAVLYRMTGRPDKALQMCLEVARLDPKDISAHYLAADLAVQMKKYAQAEDSFKKIIKIAPDRSVGYRELARLYITTNRYTEADQLARQATERQNLPENHFVLALACEKARDIPGAISAIQRAMQLKPENLNYRRFYEYLQKQQDQ